MGIPKKANETKTAQFWLINKNVETTRKKPTLIKLMESEIRYVFYINKTSIAIVQNATFQQ